VSSGGPRACVGPRNLRSGMGEGALELRATERVREHRPTLASQFDRPGASKSAIIIVVE
jgi:hypothetical protein